MKNTTIIIVLLLVNICGYSQQEKNEVGMSVSKSLIEYKQFLSNGGYYNSDTTYADTTMDIAIFWYQDIIQFMYYDNTYLLERQNNIEKLSNGLTLEYVKNSLTGDDDWIIIYKQDYHRVIITRPFSQNDRPYTQFYVIWNILPLHFNENKLIRYND